MKKILSHTFNNTTGNTRLKYVVRYMAFSCFEEKKKKWNYKWWKNNIKLFPVASAKPINWK